MKKETVDKAGEITEIIMKAGVSAIPFVGSPLMEIVNSIQSNTVNKRQDEWIEEIDQRLEKNEYEVDELGKNEFFSSALIKATEIAVRTAEKEKRVYLANAVLNSIESEPAYETTKMIYLNIIDKYTALHVRVLDFFKDPIRYAGAESKILPMTSPGLLLEHSNGFKGVDKDLLKKIVYDLETDGLIRIGEALNAMMTADGALKPRTTKLGEGLLSYISNQNE